MCEDFYSSAAIKLNEYLLKTEVLFLASKNNWLADFAENFCEVCGTIQKWQAERTLPDISFLEYTMLLTNFINRHYIAEVFVYGEKSCLDKNQRFVGEYDLSFMFVYFSEFWDYLLSERKRYVGKVSAHDITAFMIEALPKFYSYLTNIARFSIMEQMDKSPYADIVKGDRFSVNVGNYMASTEPVYVEHKTKNADKLIEWFSEQPSDKYVFEDYSNLDFSGKAFLYTDFRYARFQGSALNNTGFNGSMLIGTNFRNAQMVNCCLDNCAIYEADFSHAILRKSSFVNARGRAGLPNKEKWRHVGFLPVCFRHADLTDADFTDADLTGADFTDAILDGADFTGAVLDGAIYDNST